MSKAHKATLTLCPLQQRAHATYRFLIVDILLYIQLLQLQKAKKLESINVMSDRLRAVSARGHSA